MELGQANIQPHDRISFFVYLLILLAYLILMSIIYSISGIFVLSSFIICHLLIEGVFVIG